MKIALFALTGFGNSVLERLVSAGFAPDLVITREETGLYPYHPVEDLRAVSTRLGVPAMIGADGERSVVEQIWDAVLVCTYHRRLSLEVLAASPWPINLHPSLLPRWRGAAPMFSALDHGDKVTGVTAVRMTEELDAGPILGRTEVEILPHDTQGALRQRLSNASAELAVEMLERVQSSMVTAVEQTIEDVTIAAKPGPDMRAIEDLKSVSAVDRRVRALTPWPGATVHGRQVVEVFRLRPTASSIACRQPVREPAHGEEVVSLVCEDGVVDLLVRVERSEEAAKKR